MKIVAAQLLVTPGNPERTLDSMLCEIAAARARGADMVVFPELVWGYLLGDKWECASWLMHIAALDERVRRASAGITVVWGSVVTDRSKVYEDGRVRKYNAALVAHDGAWLSNGGPLGHFVPKSLMPKYRIFDDERHFCSAIKLAAELDVPLSDILRPFEVPLRSDGTKRVAVLICEDGWDEPYTNKIAQLYKGRADLLVNISHSPYSHEKRRARERMLTRRVRDADMPMLYVATVGLEDNGKNLVHFDGGSSLVDARGAIVWRARDHEASATELEPFAEKTYEQYLPKTGIAEIGEAVIAAVRIALEPFAKVVIGLSGGIDSAVSAALAVSAFGSERVLAVNMPSDNNSATTRRLAAQCAKCCGVEYRVLPVTHLYTVARWLLRPFMTSSLVHENLQAVIRMLIQNTVAQSVGGVFLNNGNDTELALGYFTMNGDGRGAYSFLGNLSKGQVYALGRYLNERAGRKLIPEDIFTLKPSAELSPGQNPEKGGGDPIFYPYHDALIRMWREKREDDAWVLRHLLAGDLEDEMGIERGTITKFFPDAQTFVSNLEWCWGMFNKSVFKRVQAPPVLLVNPRSFGFDLRESILAWERAPSAECKELRERALTERTLW